MGRLEEMNMTEHEACVCVGHCRTHRVCHIVAVFLCNVFGGAVRDIESWKRRNILIGPQRLDIHATNKTEETISSH